MHEIHPLTCFSCSNQQTCHFPVSSSLFGDPCPGTGKYIEVHYQCVRMKDVTTKQQPVPPWFFDLTATFMPEDSLQKEIKEATTEIPFNATTTSLVTTSVSESTANDSIKASTNSHLHG